MITTPEKMREAAAGDNDLIRRGDVLAIKMLGMTVSSIERAVRAIPIAPQPVAMAVKPLVWERGIVDMARPQPGMKYVACSTTPRGCWAWWLEGAENTRNVERDEATAKAAAQADYEARILSALTIQPADPLSDPRVVALVEAMKIALSDLESNGMDDFASANIARAALRAIGGEA